MRRVVVALFACLTAAAAVGLAQRALPPALEEMADAERAFARAAAEKGIRDAFLEYFAADAVTFTPQPSSAREPLLQQPSRPFSERELRWEPRTGDVARSGELGWLTGPSTFINHAAPKPQPHYGNYLSVWRKQADGSWRVYIDVGVSQPSLPAFPPGLTRTSVDSQYVGDEDAASAGRSLEAADRGLNAAIARDGAVAAYASRVVAGSRLHRDGSTSAVGPEAIGALLKRNAVVRAETLGAESARSGDLGFAHGSYTGAEKEAGAYVRIWARTADGTWTLMADVTQRLAPR